VTTSPPLRGIVKFEAGKAEATVTIQTADDAADEPDETIVLTLTQSAGYTISDTAGSASTTFSTTMSRYPWIHL
jgi:hypothetical protein